MNETCTCGDVLDEHDQRTRECLVDECPCIHFEADEEVDDDQS